MGRTSGDRTLNDAYQAGTGRAITVGTGGPVRYVNDVNNVAGIEFAAGQSLAVSNANEGRLRYNVTTQTFQISINGGAYFNLGAAAAGLTNTLDDAYDNIGGGGALGSGRTITVDAGAVEADTRQTSGTALLVDTGGAVTLAGADIGVDINRLTNITPGAFAITGLRIQTAATTRANTALEGAIVVNSTATAARSLDVAMGNTSGAPIQFRWGTASILTGTITAVTIDASTNVTPGANAVTGLSITIPATTVADTAGQGAIVISSTATAARVMDISVANAVANTGLVVIRYGAATILTGSIAGELIDLSTNVTPGSFGFTGLQIKLPATTVASLTGFGAIVIDSQATLLAAIDTAVALTATVGATMLAAINLRWRAATTPTGNIVGYACDFLNVSASAQSEFGFIVNMSASSALNSAAFALNSAPAGYRGCVVRGLTRQTVCTQGLYNASNDASVTYAGAYRGVIIDFAGTVINGAAAPVPGANEVSGIIVTIPATTATNTAGQGAIVVSSTATAARSLDIAMGNTSGAPIQFRWGTAAILAGSITAVTVDASTNITPGANAVTGISITIPATTRANTDGEGALVISSTATTARCVDINIANTSGVYLFNVRYGSATTLTGTVGGVLFDFATNVTGNNQFIEALSIRVAPGASTSSRCALLDWRGTAGTGATTNGILAIGAGAAVTITGALTGIAVDLASQFTPGANAVNGVVIRIPTTTRANTAGEGAIVVSSTATAARSLDVAMGNTSGAPIQFRWGTASTLAGAITAVTVDASTNVTPGANAVTGLSITIPATTRANTAGEGAIVVASSATAARVLDLNIANISGAPAQLRYGSSTTLTGALTGWTIDLGTNVVPAAQTVTGISLTIPANANASYASIGETITRSGTAITANQTWTGNLLNLQNTPTGGSGGVVLTESGVLVNINHAPVAGATAITDNTIGLRVTLTPSTANSAGLRAIDLLYGANVTGGTMIKSAFSAATTLSATLVGMQLNLTTNVTAGAQAIIGLQINSAASTSEANAILINTLATTALAAAIAITINNTQGGAITTTYGNATVLTGAIIAQDWDLATNVTPGANAVTALRLTTAATTRASTAGEGVIVIDSRATAARSLDLAVRNTSGSFVQIRYGAATSPSASITAIVVDLSTNVTIGSNEPVVLAATLPAVTGDNPATLYSVTGANAQVCRWRTKVELHTLALANTSTTTIVFPANSLGLFVSVRVTTAVTTSLGTNTFSVGVSGATTRYGSALAGAGGTTNVSPGTTNPSIYASATGIQFTAPGAETFTAGVIRVTIYFIDGVAPTS